MENFLCVIHNFTIKDFGRVTTDASNFGQAIVLRSASVSLKTWIDGPNCTRPIESDWERVNELGQEDSRGCDKKRIEMTRSDQESGSVGHLQNMSARWPRAIWLAGCR
jgi:hypothetical protein